MTVIDTTSFRSKNSSPRPSGEISCIVLHTGEGTKKSDLDELTNNRRPEDQRVSSHYYVDRAGNIYQLVSPHLMAWHAGSSVYLGRGNINAFSIGIETEHKKGQDWPEVQREALKGLCRSLISQYKIQEQWIIAHRWIAPKRKQDPTDWPNEELEVWIHDLYVHPDHTLPGLTTPMPCGLGFYDFYQAHGGTNMFGYALTPEKPDTDSLGRACTWMRFERAVFKYVYGEGVHLALLVEAAAKKWLL